MSPAVRTVAGDAEPRQGRHRAPEADLVEGLADTIAIRSDSARYGRHAAPGQHPPEMLSIAGLAMSINRMTAAIPAEQEVADTDEEVSVPEENGSPQASVAEAQAQKPAVRTRILSCLRTVLG